MVLRDEMERIRGHPAQKDHTGDGVCGNRVLNRRRRRVAERIGKTQGVAGVRHLGVDAQENVVKEIVVIGINGRGQQYADVQGVLGIPALLPQIAGELIWRIPQLHSGVQHFLRRLWIDPVNGVVVDDTGRGGERHTGAPGTFSLCLFGLTIIVSLCSKDLVKGLSMTGIGLVLASIGIDPVGGIERLTFGILWSRRELPAGLSDLA